MSNNTEYVRIAHPCHEKSEWESLEQQLAVKGEILWLYNGEFGIESDTGRVRIGQGEGVSWSSLKYIDSFLTENPLLTKNEEGTLIRIKDPDVQGGTALSIALQGLGENSEYECFIKTKKTGDSGILARRSWVTSELENKETSYNNTFSRKLYLHTITWYTQLASSASLDEDRQVKYFMLKVSFIDANSSSYSHAYLKEQLESDSALFGKITGVSGILGEYHRDGSEHYFIISEIYYYNITEANTTTVHPYQSNADTDDKKNQAIHIGLSTLNVNGGPYGVHVYLTEEMINSYTVTPLN